MNKKLARANESRTLLPRSDSEDVELISTSVKLIVLGDSKSGKTALIRQFVLNDFPESHLPTDTTTKFYPTILMNDRLFELRVTDIPKLTKFPTDALEEWKYCPGQGVRTAHAYVLVFDITRAESFRFIKHMRHHIAKLDDDRPVVVVANKLDLLESSLLNESKELNNIIPRHWRCPYIECSAKFNWHVTQVFEEVLKCIDSKYNEQQSINVPSNMRTRRCVLM